MSEEEKKKDETVQMSASDRQLVEKLMKSGEVSDEKSDIPPLEEKKAKDNDIIDSCRPAGRMDVINNGRLGIYDGQGKYIIEPEILDELRLLPKAVTEKVVDDENRNDIYMLETDIPEVLHLEFKLVVSPVGARLYLIENVYKEGGSYLETYEEKIDGINFIKVTPTHAEIMLRFNVWEDSKPDDEDLGRRFERGEFDFIISRQIYLKLLLKNMRGEEFFLEKKAFDEIMAYLKSQGEFGKKILSAFIKRLEARKDIFDKLPERERHKVMNDILFSAIRVILSKEQSPDPGLIKLCDNIFNIRTETLDWAYQNARRKILPSEIKVRLDVLKNSRAASLKKGAPITLRPMLKIRREQQKTAEAGAAVKEKSKPKPVKKPAKAPSKSAQFKSKGGGGKGKGGGKPSGGGAKGKAAEKKPAGNDPYWDMLLSQAMRRRMLESQQEASNVQAPPPEPPTEPKLKVKFSKILRAPQKSIVPSL